MLMQGGDALLATMWAFLDAVAGAAGPAHSTDAGSRPDAMGPHSGDLGQRHTSRSPAVAARQPSCAPAHENGAMLGAVLAAAAKDAQAARPDVLLHLLACAT